MIRDHSRIGFVVLIPMNRYAVQVFEMHLVS